MAETRRVRNSNLRFVSPDAEKETVRVLDVAVVYLADTDPQIRQRFEAAARRSGCRLHFGTDKNTDENRSLAEARNLIPDVFVIATANDKEADEQFCRRFKSEPALQFSCLLLLQDNALKGMDWPDAGPDDVLMRSAGVYEITARLQSCLRVSRLRRQVAWQRAELERGDTSHNSDDALEATAHLVEIAAELQSEVCHSAEREQAHVRTAQADTIAQAAAALRHEINNPLFAIMGSAESAVKRLHALRNTGGLAAQDAAHLEAAITGIERIQRGGERIQQVVLSISDMLAPATKDYVAGVPMLDIHKKPEELR